MPVNIPIDDTWKITSDKHGYQLCYFSHYDKEDHPVWIAKKFAGTIRTVLEGWAEQKIRQSDAATFKELYREVLQIRERLDEIVANCAVTSRETASIEKVEA